MYKCNVREQMQSVESESEAERAAIWETAVVMRENEK